MTKLDLKKKYKHLYMPSSKQVTLVDVPPFNFAMIDGAIEPGKTPNNSPAFEQALNALYGISYTLKFMSKRREIDPIDYTVMALEGLWWVEDGDFNIEDPGNWHYRVMMMQPDHITEEMFSEALHQPSAKKPNPSNELLRFETFHEGTCLQILHIGPYSEEMKTIAKIDAYAEEHGFEMIGRHHEIYIGDPRRADPEKLKTVLRHPVRPIEELTAVET